MRWLGAAPTGAPLEVSSVSHDAAASTLISMFGSEQICLSIARTIPVSVWSGSGFDQVPAPEVNQGKVMNIKRNSAAFAAFIGLAVMSVAAFADDHAYTDGPVVNVAAIRTEYGKFDEYMKYLDTTWKAEQEAAKRAGYILSYRVITVEARGENDADIYLVTNYKNWAAFDGATAKADAIAKQVEGSLAASNEGAVDRGKIRRILGSWTGQELDLK
jgi:hypothetical protein